jgi:hypothetical protein
VRAFNIHPLRKPGANATLFDAALLCLAAAIAVHGGCVAGPSALRASRTNYNLAIQQSTSEQLLLNLVRLKYRDVPFFLEVGSVAAQFTFEGSLDGRVVFNEDVGVNSENPDVYGISAGLGYSERPTITYAPLQGEDFVERLLSPLTIDTILLLTRSGWSLDRVLRLTVQRVNDLDNASNASSPTPIVAPEFEEFRRMAHLLRQLQMDGAIEIEYETTEIDASHPIAIERFTPSDVLDALQSGHGVRRTPDGKAIVFTATRSTPVLRIAPDWMNSDEIKQLVEMLDLKPGLPRYALTVAAGSSRSSGPHESISFETRSLMGVLFYLSQAVEVPESHADLGWITRTVDANSEPFDWARVTGNLLRIRTARGRPARSAVAVKYRGAWFYINDAELSSKSTFSLLSQLFALKAGDAKTERPVLTLPLGG